MYGSIVMAIFAKSRSTFGECPVCRQFVEKVKSVSENRPTPKNVNFETFIISVFSLPSFYKSQ